MNLRYLHFILLSVVFQAGCQISLKYAASLFGDSSFAGIITNTFYLLSLLFLVAQAFVWQQAIIHYPLSIVYPFMSLVNFVVLIAAAILFSEGISSGNIIGLLMISLGIVLISRERRNIS